MRKFFHKINFLALYIWSKCNGDKNRQLLLIGSVLAVVITIAILFYIYRETIRDIAIIIGIILFFWERKSKPIAQIPVYQMAVRTTELMTEILTLLHAEIGIRKPYDVYSVWKNPTKSGEVWTYHAKARQADNVQLDPDSLEEYMALINGRAEDIGAPLEVTNIHPRGNTFVYDVSVSGAALSYLTPKEAETRAKAVKAEAKEAEARGVDTIDRDF